MSFSTSAFFDRLEMFSIRLGLESTRELAHLAGNPENSLRFIHIAGTNGKGSTGAMLERTLREAGFSTGFYTSPHLIDVRERFRINGKTVDEETFEYWGKYLADIAGTKYSYFEYATVLAMLIFKAAKCDVVVWETGLGGRLCATNIVTPQLCIITNIALDHTDHLGDTIAKIAAEKAGIIKRGVPLVCGKLPDDAKAVIEARAQEMDVKVFPCREAVPEKYTLLPGDDGVPLQKFTYDNREITLALPGRMQRENFRIVYEALEILSKQWNFNFETALEGLSKVRWPGRFQRIGDRMILDGGHNPDGTAALAEALNELYPGEKFTTVYAAFANKNAGECVQNLSKFTEQFIFTSPGTWNRKAFKPEELISFASQCNIPANGNPVPLKAVEEALKISPRRVIISGSLYLAGEVLQHYMPLESTLDI
ncbi:MAG: bifunctional folylpolyglutamate synthase/dihydrofolate synthase [Lentisphaerae bacterium]|nr:bifunctional folylpolyglutamate synthase/dihydrofolate synthase [Lentisphaerota bacterium]